MAAQLPEQRPARTRLSRVLRATRRLLASRLGGTAIEYTLLACVIGVGMLAGVTMLQSALDEAWEETIAPTIGEAIENAA